MDWSTLLVQATVNGMVVGLLYLLMAVGFTLVFGVMRIVNFAHGEFYMLGAFAAYFITAKAGLPFLATLAVTFIGAVVLGILLEVLVLKPFRQDELNGMITTIGLAMIVQNLALMVFGPDPLSMPAIVRGVTRMGGVVIPTSRLYVVGFALAVLGFAFSTRPTFYALALAVAILSTWGLYRLFRQPLGQAIDSVAVNPALAEATGLSVHRIQICCFVAGCAIAAVAGILQSRYIGYISPESFNTSISVGLIIMLVIGGRNSSWGPLVGAIVLTPLPELFRGAVQTQHIFYGAALILILRFMPGGLADLPRRLFTRDQR